MAKTNWLKVDPSQGSGNATASLYEAIDKEHSGDADDPIPYTPPMEIYIDKYYIENGIVYRCIRDSGIALTHSLNSLVGLYVEAL